MDNLMKRVEKKVKRYVKERLCKSGGFCFYRMDEPNGSDTYYALSILDILNEEFYDEHTVDFLKGMQNDDGGYSSVYSAYYSIKGLKLLGEKPDHDYRDFLKRNPRIYDVNNLPAGLQSIFRQIYYTLDLYRDAEIDIDSSKREKLIDFIMFYKNSDNGFGYEISTLLETYHALSSLLLLKQNFPEAVDFLKRCEDRFYGFVNVPGTSPSFIEYIHAGLEISEIFGYTPVYANKIIDFILDCQNLNGGFSRSPVGLSNLENTYYAIRSLEILSDLSPKLL